MIENVCKNCNAPLDMAEAKNGVVTCAFCGSVFTLPKKDASDKVRKHLDAGETALDQCRFDDALASYTKAIEADGSEPEGYWGRALARNRVQYLRDTVNNRLQPICHEVSEESFTSDPDYKRALTLATEEQRAEYAKKGEEIDYIRSEFYALERTGLKYDCFICVKVTEEDGGHTEDSFAALKLYNALKKAGYRPFFSEEEMGERTGADYEALILYALKSAGSLLIVCSDKRYLETKWVKNEYTRYAAMLTDEEKERGSMAIVYLGKPIEKLPGLKGKLQGVDYRQFDAMDRIRAFIDSHDEGRRRAGAERAAKEREEQERAAKEKAAAEQDAIAAMQAELKRMRETLAARESGTAPAVPVAPAPAVRPAPAETKPVPPVSAPAVKPEKPKPEFEIEDGVLIRYNGTGENVTVPGMVTKIRENAFYRPSLKKIVFPIGLKTICQRAFTYSGLTEVALPAGITIENRAFEACKALTTVIFMGDADIGEQAFGQCSSLTTVRFPDKAKVKIGAGAFIHCAIRSLRLPDGTTVIGENAFYGNHVEEVYIPASVKRIGNDAFFGDEKTRLVCAAQGKQDGWDKYWNRATTYFDTPLRNIRWGYLPPDPALAAVSADFRLIGTTLEKYVGKGGAVTIPAGVTKIADYAFSDSETTVTSVTVPEGVTEIGADAFSDCAALRAISLPAGLISIGRDAFSRCEKLRKVILPDSVTRLGGAFTDCKALGTVTLSAGLVSLGTGEFEGTALKDIRIPAGVTEIGARAFANCKALETVTLPAGLTSIGVRAFSQCEKLREVILPDTVTAIGERAFEHCTALQRIVIPASVATMGANVFYGCTALTEAALLSADTVPGFGAFNGCANLTKISFPDGLQTIPNGLCQDTGLTEIVVPAGVKKIGQAAFSGCTHLRKAVLPEGLASIGFLAFSKCENLSDVVFPESLKELGDKAFAGCRALTTAVFTDVSKVGKGVFDIPGTKVLFRCKKPRKKWPPDWVAKGVKVKWNVK